MSLNRSPQLGEKQEFRKPQIQWHGSKRQAWRGRESLNKHLQHHSCSKFHQLDWSQVLGDLYETCLQPELHWIHPSNVGCCQDFVATGTSGSIRWAVENMDVDKWGTITTCWAEDPGRDQDKSSWDQKSMCDTLDGRNPAPPGMYKTLWVMGYSPY